jgi:hypothetical protein
MGCGHSTNGVGAEVISTAYFHSIPIDCRRDKQKVWFVAASFPIP